MTVQRTKWTIFAQYLSHFLSFSVAPSRSLFARHRFRANGVHAIRTRRHFVHFVFALFSRWRRTKLPTWARAISLLAKSEEKNKKDLFVNYFVVFVLFGRCYVVSPRLPSFSSSSSSTSSLPPVPAHESAEMWTRWTSIGANLSLLACSHDTKERYVFEQHDFSRPIDSARSEKHEWKIVNSRSVCKLSSHFTTARRQQIFAFLVGFFSAVVDFCFPCAVPRNV